MEWKPKDIPKECASTFLHPGVRNFQRALSHAQIPAHGTRNGGVNPSVFAAAATLSCRGDQVNLVASSPWSRGHNDPNR
jgi:hypothetical protein